jgi:hypothetical protein
MERQCGPLGEARIPIERPLDCAVVSLAPRICQPQANHAMLRLREN